jgi:hypothetical protein
MPFRLVWLVFGSDCNQRYIYPYKDKGVISSNRIQYNLVTWTTLIAGLIF